MWLWVSGAVISPSPVVCASSGPADTSEEGKAWSRYLKKLLVLGQVTGCAEPLGHMWQDITKKTVLLLRKGMEADVRVRFTGQLGHFRVTGCCGGGKI